MMNHIAVIKNGHFSYIIIQVIWPFFAYYVISLRIITAEWLWGSTGQSLAFLLLSLLLLMIHTPCKKSNVPHSDRILWVPFTKSTLLCRPSPKNMISTWLHRKVESGLELLDFGFCSFMIFWICTPYINVSSFITSNGSFFAPFSSCEWLGHSS